MQTLNILYHVTNKVQKTIYRIIIVRHDSRFNIRLLEKYVVLRCTHVLHASEFEKIHGLSAIVERAGMSIVKK